MGIAERERQEIAELFVALGPDAPTLCGDWRTRDLAAHLVLRERRPDAAIGIIVSAFAEHTAKVQKNLSARPWAELINLVRTGPPWYSVYAIPKINELANAIEYFVHHEDVRRAQPNWQPRDIDQKPLWKLATMAARLGYRKSPVGIALRTPTGEYKQVKQGPSVVTIVGQPAELVVYSFGRAQAHVDVQGDPVSVDLVRQLDRSL